MNVFLIVSVSLFVSIVAKPLGNDSTLCHIMCHAEHCEKVRVTEDCTGPELDACEAECPTKEPKKRYYDYNIPCPYCTAMGYEGYLYESCAKVFCRKYY